MCTKKTFLLSKFIVVFIFILLTQCITSLHAQSDSTLKEYYPLAIGNHWEYWDGGEIVMRTIIGDTTMPNGNTYKISEYRMESGFLGYYYNRIDDSLNVWQLGIFDSSCNGERIVFKLSLPDSTIWTECTLFGHEPTVIYPCLSRTFLQYYQVLNQVCTTKTFCPAYIDTVAQDTFICVFTMEIERTDLAKGFGMVYQTGETFEWFLTGAIINGIRYGTITSVPFVPANKTLNEVTVYPNPFNGTTNIVINLSEPGFLKVEIYNSLGELLKSLFEGFRYSGQFQIPVQSVGLELSSGVYFIKTFFNKQVSINKILLLK